MATDSSTQKKDKLLNLQEIKDAIKNGYPLSITTYTFPFETETYMSMFLSTFLDELGQGYLLEYFLYCLKELINNARRANVKRIYFEEKELEITQIHDYEKGLLSFKNDIAENQKYYFSKLKASGLFVKFIVQVKNNILRFEIVNNTELTVFEYKRIHDRLIRAFSYSSVDDFSDMEDTIEGAGFGLFTVFLILKKLGISGDNFQVLSDTGKTIIRIMFPLKKQSNAIIFALSKEISDKLSAIPSFPENIAQINQLISEPNTKISDIVMHINNDVALTTDLLRMVNKASFRTATPCANVSLAVKMVGLEGIKNMLYTIGALKNLKIDENSQKKLWDHATKTAAFSYMLSCRLCIGDKNIISDAYVCGLLHDIGKILFNSAYSDIIEKFKDTTVREGISDRIFEKIFAGATHAEIGALVTKNWNFPDVITYAIQYHHNPLLAPIKYRKSVEIVYLANMFIKFQNDEIDFNQFDMEVLKDFQLGTQSLIEELSLELKILYNH